MKKLFKPLILVALLCIVIAGLTMALIGCSLFSSNEPSGMKPSNTSYEFIFTRITKNDDIALRGGFTYSDEDEDGYSARLTSTSIPSIMEISNIPTEYDGKPVYEVKIQGTAITNLVIPEGIRYINLSGNTQLVDVDLPTTLLALTRGCFSGCISLNNVDVPENVSIIDSYAFGACSALTELKLPTNLTAIRSNAFDTGSSEYAGVWLDQKNWIDNVFYLDKHLIYRKGAWEPFTIQSGTTTICDYVKVSNDEQVNLPKSIKCIGKDVFRDEDSLDTVHFGGSISDWCSIVFKNAFSNPVYARYRYRKDNMIDNYVKYNTHYLYNDPNNTIINNLYCVKDGKDTLMETIDLPSEATRVNDYALMGFNCLKSFNVIQNPTSRLKYIGKRAFEGCYNLTSVTLGTNVEEIGEGAFAECRKINNVRVYSDRYKSYEYTDSDESQWILYNCIIDVEDKKVVVFTLREMYVPVFVTSFDTSTLCLYVWRASEEAVTCIKYEGDEKQFADIKNNDEIFNFVIHNTWVEPMKIEYNYRIK